MLIIDSYVLGVWQMPWEIDTVPDDSDSEDPPDKVWDVTVKWSCVRSFNFVKAPDAYWAVERVYHNNEEYDYDESGGSLEEVIDVKEELSQ